MPPFDLAALLVATCRFTAVALRYLRAMGLRQSGLPRAFVDTTAFRCWSFNNSR